MRLENAAPRNLVVIVVGGIGRRCLVDTGAACSILGSRLFHSISHLGIIKRHDKNPQNFGLFSADTSPVKVIAIVDLQIEIQGVKFELTCRVVKNLAFDLVLGLDFLREAQATIDIQSDTLELRKYNLTVPLVAYQAIKSDTRSSKPLCARQQIRTHAVIAPIVMGEKWEPEPPPKIEQLSSVDDMRKEL